MMSSIVPRLAPLLSPANSAQRLNCVVAGVCAAKPTGSFDKLLDQAALLAGDGRGDQDAAIAVYFQALQASSGFDQAVELASALPPRYSYRDVTTATLGQVIMRAATPDQALTGAQAAWSKGRGYDRWTQGALEKGLELGKSRPELLAIAQFAGDRGYTDVARRAVERANGA